MRGAVIAWVLVRVLFFTVLALTFFVLGFLGYFTIPFFLFALALVLFAGTRYLAHARRAEPPRSP